MSELLSQEVLTGIGPLPDDYRPLLESVVDLLAADDRVLAVFLGGSIGRRVADIGSDLDLLVTVADDEFDAVGAEIAGRLAAAVDPIVSLAVPGMPGSFAFTTRSCLRIDVVLEKLGEVDRPAFRSRIVVFDRADVRRRISAPFTANDGPDVAAIGGFVTEFFRQQAIFPAAVVGREDWLLGQEGVHNARQLLYRVFVEANQPLPVMGVKQWSSKLTADQRAVLSRVHPPHAERASVMACMHAVRRAFCADGRIAIKGAGGSWPQDLEDATTEYWRRSGLEP